MQLTLLFELFRIALVVVLWLWPLRSSSGIEGSQVLEGSEADTERSLVACPIVAITPFFTFAYGVVQVAGNDVSPGTVIRAVSPRGDLVGCFEVTDAGAYGAMPIYGEDTSTNPTIPGMRNGETVLFRVDGILASASPSLIWHDDYDLHRVDLDAQSTALLDPPTDLSMSSASQSQIDLSWTDNSSDESAFHIERSGEGSQYWAEVATVGASVTSYGDAGLPSGSTYHYRVRACRDSDGACSTYSNVAEGTTIGAVLPPPDVNKPPYEPSEPSPEDGTTAQSSDVDLSWSGGDPDGDAVTYKVYLAAEGSSVNRPVCIDVASTFCDPGALDHETNYQWWVVAEDERGAVTTGPVWGFATAAAARNLALAPPNPKPDNTLGRR